MIRLTVPSIDETDLQAVSETLATGYLVQGARVAEFEQAAAEFTECRYAVAVSNCTAALHMALLASGVRHNDRVLVTSYSWPATANVIELCGATPVFVDIRSDTFNMDPDQLEHALIKLVRARKSYYRVQAILPVHTFGQVAEMPAIIEIAGKFGIPVIEDAACALGARLQDKQAGGWGVMSCFSFHPRKAITTGEGGLVTTNDYGLTATLRALRNHGLDPDAPLPDFVMPGFNYRMTEFQAALGLTQLRKIDRIINARRLLANHYNQLLEGTVVQAPVSVLGATHVYQSYVVLLPTAAAKRRPEIIQSLKSEGVETNIGTWHMPMITYYRQKYGFLLGDFPVTDDVFARSLTLPLYEGLTPGEQEEVVVKLLEEISRFMA